MSTPLTKDREATWDKLKALALNACPSTATRRAYNFALDDFRAWYESSGEQAPPFSKATINAYRLALEHRGLSASSINLRLTAIKKLVSEAADNGQVDQQLAAGVAHIKGKKRLGTRLGNWLTKEQAEALIDAPGDRTLTGKRDRAMLATLRSAC